MPNFYSGLECHLESIESKLDAYTSSAVGCPNRLADAIRYSVLAPGKRLRPLLAMLACGAVGGNPNEALPVACAVELIHVYSLIHDDLPCMDDDDLRRGKPTCHRQFDEATAVLAGDSLQMLAIEVICQDMPAKKIATCCEILSKAAGRTALVGGQADDLAAEGRYGAVSSDGMSEIEFLKHIHRRKTGALIEASLQLGGVAGGASMDHLRGLARFGHNIGLAFQIIDDCLDVESTSEQLGKNTRKDNTLGKLTYPSLLGLSQSHELAKRLARDAKEEIAVLGSKADKLSELADFVVERRA